MDRVPWLEGPTVQLPDVWLLGFRRLFLRGVPRLKQLRAFRVSFLLARKKKQSVKELRVMREFLSSCYERWYPDYSFGRFLAA